MALRIRKKRAGENTGLYTLALDIFEVYYLLESCFRGSHLRAPTIEHFVDFYYDKMTEEDRYRLYVWISREFCEPTGEYIPRDQLCNADVWFFARFNPDNQYEVTYMNLKHEEQKIRAFKLIDDDAYYVNIRTSIVSEAIVSVKKLDITLPPNIA